MKITFVPHHCWNTATIIPKTSTLRNGRLNNNRLTLKAGKAALEDTAYFEKTCAAIVETRSWTKQQLEARGFTVLNSRTNFLFASTGKKGGGELYRKLKEKGVLVRHFDAPRITDWLRITIGTPEDMEALLRALDEILEG